MKFLKSKYIAMVLIGLMSLPMPTFAQTPSTYTKEQLQLAKSKTYSLYHPEYPAGRTIELFKERPYMTTFILLGIAGTSYLSLGMYDLAIRVNQAYKMYQMTDHGLINDTERLTKYIQNFFDRDYRILPTEISGEFKGVNHLLDIIFDQIHASDLSRIEMSPKDPGLKKDWAKLARIIQDLQFVNHKKYHEYFMGLRRFGYQDWVVTQTKQAKTFATNNRLQPIAPGQEHLFENRTLKFEKELKAKGKISRRIIRGTGALIGAYLIYELILTLMYPPSEDPNFIEALNVLPEELDEMARTDWENFALIADRNPALWMAGGQVYDSSMKAEHKLKILDEFLELTSKN